MTKILKNLLITAVIILFSLSIAGDEYSDLFNDYAGEASMSGSDTNQKENSVNDDIAVPALKFSMSGFHGFDFHIPVIKDYMNFNGNIKSPRFRNDLGVELSYKDFDMVLNWQFDFLPAEFTGLDKSSFIDASNSLIDILPLENRLSYSPWKFKFSAGYLYFDWGNAFGKNPTDNINSRDYTFDIYGKKLSVLAVSADFYPIDQIWIQVLYLPFKGSDIFPESIPDKIHGMLGIAPTINHPDYDFSSFVVGSRVSFFLRYIDFSLSYLYDIDPFYSLNITLSPLIIGSNALFSPTAIELSRKRVHRLGADIKTTIGIVGLWAEACYTITEDYAMDDYTIRNHKLVWIAGLEFNYGQYDDFYFTFQYTGEFIPKFDQTLADDYNDGTLIPNQPEDYYAEYFYRKLTDQIGGYTEGLLQGVTLFMKWPLFDSRFTPSFAAVYMLPLLYDDTNEKKLGYMKFSPELDFSPIDSMHLIIGADVYLAIHKNEGEDAEIDENSKLGKYYKESNIYIKFNYKWDYELTK